MTEASVLQLIAELAGTSIVWSAAGKGSLVVAFALVLVLGAGVGAPHWRHAALMGALFLQSLLLLHALILPDWRWQVVPLPEGLATESAVVLDTYREPAAPAGVGVTRSTATGQLALGARETKEPDGLLLATVLLTWFLGAGIGLGRVGVGVVRAHRLARRGEPLCEGAVAALADDCRATLGVRRKVALRVDPEVDVPATVGVFRPVILLPPKAVRWESRRLRAVMLHEMAHVRNCDVLNQLITAVSRAVHWPHPLTHLACRLVARERECMADLAAVRSGVGRGEYVAHLVGVLREARGWAAQPVGLAGGRTSLERRLRSLLEMRGPSARPRNVLPASAVVVLTVGLPFGLLAPRAPGVELEASASAGSSCMYAGGRHLDRLRTVDGRSRWTVEWEGEDCRVRWEVVGNVRLDARTGTVEPGGPADSLLVVSEGPRAFRLVVSHDGREALHEASGAGIGALLDDRGRLRRAAFARWLVELDRHTAFALEQRFESLAGDGLDALLHEVSRTGGGHAGALYLTAAVERLPLTESEVSRVLAAALEHPPNDAMLERLLVSVAGRYPLAGREARLAYLEVASRIEARAAREKVTAAPAG